MSEILLEEANPRGDREWEEFLNGETDGTLFHRLSFLSYHPEGRFRAHPMKARLDGRLVAVLPIADGEGESDGDIASPYGGSFGGFACVAGLGAAEHTALLDSVLAWARQRGYGSLWISARPAPYRVHGDGAEFALASRGGRVVRREITHIADLSHRDADSRVRGTSRRGARKAERLGTTVRSGTVADIERFHALLTADRARLGAAPTHSRDDLHALFAARPGDFQLQLADNDGELVGGLLLFRSARDVALSFYTCRADSPRAERCMNLLTERALEESRALGRRWLDFGTSSIGGVLNAGLAEFKEGFGGIPFVRETWRVPLS